LNQNYAPAGTSLINGVEVEGLGKVGVSILASLDLSTTLPRRVSGTATGEGSSATNWAIPFGPASYKVILHCTSDFERGYSR
jgi:hypothetical protein